MKTCKLENWALVIKPAHPYEAPELSRRYLTGNISGHPLFKDGDFVTTSRIMGHDGEMIMTRNTYYILGNPHPDYEKMFPDAKARLLKQLQ